MNTRAAAVAELERRIGYVFRDRDLLERALTHSSVGDGAKSVRQVLGEVGNKAGGPVKISAYVRMQLGEGIEKKDDDFAAEVAKAAGA